MPRTRTPFANKSAFGALERITRELRLQVVETAYLTKHNLQAEALACCEVMASLLWHCLRIDPKNPEDPGRDRLIFDHKNASLALYAALAKRGFFPEAELAHYEEAGSKLPLRPIADILPGIEWSMGSAHHGLGGGLGMALAAEIQSRRTNAYVLLDDSCAQEGVIWESATLASRLKCANLTAIITTHQQASPGLALTDMWQAHGWAVRELDGHQLEGLVDALLPRSEEGSPVAVIARTRSGCGVSFAESDDWHDRTPTAAEMDTARKELAP